MTSREAKRSLMALQRTPSGGFVLQPGRLYLGATQEYTETHATVPFLEGKSSVGRLGIDIHATAGKGVNLFGLVLQVRRTSVCSFSSNPSWISSSAAPETRSGAPSQVAPPPSAALQSRPDTGSITAPATEMPSCTAANDTAYQGIP